MQTVESLLSLDKDFGFYPSSLGKPLKDFKTEELGS
jgi:hypothetical protein